MDNLLGDYIRQYRIAHSLSLREFAERASISHTHIDSIEKGFDFRTGKAVRITNETIQKLANVLNVNATIVFNLSINENILNDELSYIEIESNRKFQCNSNFGSRLRLLREHAQLTQEQLGKIIGQTKSNISKYENGSLEPSLNTLVKIAKCFKVSTDYLLETIDSINFPEQNKEPPGHLTALNFEIVELIEKYEAAPENLKTATKAMLGMTTSTAKDVKKENIR